MLQNGNRTVNNHSQWKEVPGKPADQQGKATRKLAPLGLSSGRKEKASPVNLQPQICVHSFRVCIYPNCMTQDPPNWKLTEVVPIQRYFRVLGQKPTQVSLEEQDFKKARPFRMPVQASPVAQCWRIQMQSRSHGRRGFSLWVGKIPWRRAWWPTAVFLPAESHGQRSLVGHSPWRHKEWLSTHTGMQIMAATHELTTKDYRH